MTVSARKIAAFAKLVAGLADVPNLGSSTLLKQWFDSSPEELRVAINGLIDDLISAAAGASGTEQIGSAPISGVAGATAYAQLVDLKNQLNAVVLGQIPDGSLTTAKFATEAVTQVKTRGLVYTQDLYGQSWVVSGGVVTASGSPANQITVTNLLANILQADSSYRRMFITGTTYVTSIINATYYLEFQPDGTMNWSQTHSTQSGYMPIATVTSNASGNINVITDNRVTAPKLTGSVDLTTAQTIGGVKTFSSPMNTSNIMSSGFLKLIAPNGVNPNKYLRSDTGNFQVLNESAVLLGITDTGDATIAGALTAGAGGSFANSKVQNGYQKLPGGIIYQWGAISVASGTAITYPIPFPTGIFSVVVTPAGSAAFTVGTNGGTTSGFTVYHGNGVTPTVMSWMSIGY